MQAFKRGAYSRAALIQERRLTDHLRYMYCDESLLLQLKIKINNYFHE
jgi:hypothetical protein